ncbi:MAG: YlzJ-like family protein [Bacillota bacterium]
MILYTPLPPEEVLEGFPASAPRTVEVRSGDALLMVEDIGSGQGRLVRLISGNPYDYLKPEWTPGAVIRLP